MVLSNHPYSSGSKSSRSAADDDQPASVPASQETAIGAALVARFNAGDESAFNEMVERYRARIFHVTFGLLRNHADAEEITQDTFIRAYRGLARFRGDASLASWLYRIAVNLARNRYWYFHRRRRQDWLSLDSTLSEDTTGTFADLVATAEADPSQEAATAEFSDLVDTCMAELEAPHQEILTLRNVRNHSYKEIATALGINTGTVKSRIARARENLRARLTANCPDFSPDDAPGHWLSPARGYAGPAAAAC